MTKETTAYLDQRKDSIQNIKCQKELTNDFIDDSEKMFNLESNLKDVHHMLIEFYGSDYQNFQAVQDVIRL